MYVYLKNRIDAFWDELDRSLQKCVENQEKDLMEEIRRSLEINSFRNIVKIKGKYAHGYLWPSYLHKDVRYIIYNLVRFLTYKQFDI